MLMQDEQTVRGGMARAALCVVLSLVLHGGMVWGALMWLREAGVVRRGGAAGGDRGVRVVQVVREQVPKEEGPRTFAKTDPDAEERAPLEADFVGKRHAVASGAEYAPERRSDAPLPTQNGEEQEDVVTFDQERQEGDLAYDGKVELPEAVPAAGVPLPPEVPVQQQLPEVPVPEVADEVKAASLAGVQSVLQEPVRDEEGELQLRAADDAPGTEAVQPQEGAARPALVVLPRGVSGEVYDPALAEHMQQRPAGFRTRERRTRSTGRFVVGSKPSLNVASTPQGRYEEEIYRRVAYFWYIACDEHRGDIIPGSVVISLRVNARGQLANMDLVRRTGASISQQSFTFGAIRRASLPPMPPAVQQELVGDLLELIFQFNFD